MAYGLMLPKLRGKPRYPGQTLFWRADSLILPPGFSMTRSGANATYFDSAGLLQTAGANVARFSYNPATLALKGLMVEAAATNLVVQSETMTIANGWTKFSGTAGETTGVTDPANTTKAITLTGVNGNTNVGHYRTVTFTGDGTKVASCFVKAGTAPSSFVSVYDNTAGTHLHKVLVTWTGGTPSLSTSVGGGTLYTPEQLVNGWWRIGFSVASVVAANANVFAIFPDALAVGARTTSFYGGQAEDNTAPTSYIATAGATATRNADVLTAPTSGLLVNGQGFAGIEYETIVCGTNGAQISTYAGAGGIPITTNATTAFTYNGTVLAQVAATAQVPGEVERIAATWLAGSYLQVACNGVVGSSAAIAGNMNLGSTIRIGDHVSGVSEPISMYLKSLRLGVAGISPKLLAMAAR